MMQTFTRFCNFYLKCFDVVLTVYKRNNYLRVHAMQYIYHSLTSQTISCNTVFTKIYEDPAGPPLHSHQFSRKYIQRICLSLNAIIRNPPHSANDELQNKFSSYIQINAIS